MFKFQWLALPAAVALIFLPLESRGEVVIRTETDPLVSPSNTKSFLVRLEPHWIARKEISLDFQFRLSDKVSLGPTFATMRDAEGVYSGGSLVTPFFTGTDRSHRESIGLRAAYYFKDMNTSSAYVSHFLRYSRNHVTRNDSNPWSYPSAVYKGTFDEASGGLNGGYQWVWIKMLTLNVGGGLAYYSHPRNLTLVSDRSSVPDEVIDLSPSAVGFSFDAGIGVQF
jgi:hypothetical protein